MYTGEDRKKSSERGGVERNVVFVPLMTSHDSEREATGNRFFSGFTEIVCILEACVDFFFCSIIYIEHRD